MADDSTPSDTSASVQAGSVQASKKLDKYVTGKAQLSRGLRMRGAKITVENLKGKRLKEFKARKTTAGGGVFFKAKGLPTHFVVAVSGTSRPKSNGYGTLRAFVDRHQSTTVEVSFGTTVAVQTYRLADGKWSRSKSIKRTIKALRLPSFTRVGFDDRVNRAYISRKILLQKSKGNIDKMSMKVAKAAKSGKKSYKFYSGQGPYGVTGPQGTLGLAKLPKGGKRGRELTGVVADLENVFNYGSALWADVSAGSATSTTNQELNQLQSLNNQMDQLSEQVSNLQTSLNNGLAALAAQDAQYNYNNLVNAFNKSYEISTVLQWFEQIQTTPCPGYSNCSSSDLTSGYDQVLSDFGPAPSTASPPIPPTNPSAPYLTSQGEAIVQSILDYEGAGGIMSAAWGLSETQTAAGKNAMTTNPDFDPPLVSKLQNGMSNPVSAQVVALQQFWIGQAQQVLLFGVNYEEQYPNAGYQTILQYEAYNIVQAMAATPDVVPSGMLLDGTIDALWASLGQVQLNTSWQAPISPPAGSSVTVTGGVPQVTFNSQFTAPAGSTITSAQAQGYTWAMPQATVNYCDATGVGCWTSPQLGNGEGGSTSGLLSLFSSANPANQWEYAAAIPVTSPSNGANLFEPLLVGLTSSPQGYFSGQGVPLWVYANDEPGAASYYTFLEGDIAYFYGETGAYDPPNLPTSTPDWLLYSSLTASQVECFEWAGLSANTPPSNYSVPTSVPTQKCSATS